jgi:hypothetical protein
MALRNGRGAGPGRVARGRAGVVALAVALYLGAGLYAAQPALGDIDSHFFGYGKPVESVVTPGDHLQTAYNLWLPGHSLGDGRAPWLDHYSFQPEAEKRINYAGWPFALVFWPLQALLGTVGAWNAFVLLTYIGAGACAALWLRALGLPLGAALVGGLVFALAPYRSLQTAGGHLLGPISMLLPLSLWGVETRRTWLAAAALASIPLSGQVHLALGAIPFFIAYAAARRGSSNLSLAGVSGGIAIAAGVLVWATSIRGTSGASGRSYGQVERYSAELLDFVTRHSRHGFETMVLLGWLTPLVALVGLVVVARRDRTLALVLGLGAVVPVVLALGANTPLYKPLWEHLPGLGQTRVPARLLPIACLCLAALFAYALARVRWRYAAVVAVALVAADARVDTFDALVADEHNAIYAQLRKRPEGGVLERPVFLPERQEGSVYLYYSMQAPRERPLGYSTTAPPEGLAAARGLRRGEDPERYGVRWVVGFRGGRPVELTSP